MNNHALRAFLMQWQFWALEAQFAFLLVTTTVELRRVRVRGSTVAAACVVALCAWALTATAPPRTNRIYYDEQIYQGVGRNLADLHRAQMCNDGSVEYGRLQCAQGEYNKEPNGFPYLLSLVYRVAGVSDAAAFRLNNLVAGLSVLATIILAALLFNDARIAVLSGIVLALLPMQLQWSNTAAVEPVAALLCASSMVAAVHFARMRTTSALVWTIAVTAFTLNARPECALIVPVIALTLLLLAPHEFLTRRLWLGAAGGAVVSSLAVLHILAVSNEGWGTTGPPLSWQHAVANFSTNLFFFFRDERFSALCGAAAVVGLLTPGRLRERLTLFGYFLAFWLVFLFFYAGSYNYGADVRYSLMTFVPIAILAAAGLWRLADHTRWLTRGSWTDGLAFAAIAAILLAQFLWYLPLVRETGEEAWAARSDVKYAREFVARLPPNSVVLTHNPSMFHMWNVSAAQMSVTRGDPHAILRLQSRFAGGVYLHWNYWCNVPDPVQNSFCKAGLNEYAHELVESRRERDFEYALYRMQGERHPVPEVQK
jgi:Dolichyl-phosphate-mannose-protein mannosyltransferase